MIELAEWAPSGATNGARFSRSAPTPPAALRTEAGGCRGLEDKAGADALERRRQPDASSLKGQLECSAAIRRSFANTARPGIEALDERIKAPDSPTPSLADRHNTTTTRRAQHLGRIDGGTFRRSVDGRLSKPKLKASFVAWGMNGFFHCRRGCRAVSGQ
jgi:hypothetical protein